MAGFTRISAGPDDVLQRALADHRIQRLAHDLLRQLQRRLGELDQDAVFAMHPAELGADLVFDLLLRPHADLVHELDQQLDQAVDHLRLARPAQRGQQREPHPVGGGIEVGGYIFIARARHPATIFSDTPSNKPSGNPIAFTRSSLTISASSVSSCKGRDRT
ncbi:hypothetical protein [Nonomuraea deserti]|uniref:hypothetical protein n=1 Tax=Nonomuraea deserti TaxID=1848322 RepID=UPI001404D1E8|nr:hypothetical protein [Nonomuraea deserti]